MTGATENIGHDSASLDRVCREACEAWAAWSVFHWGSLPEDLRLQDAMRALAACLEAEREDVA